MRKFLGKLNLISKSALWGRLFLYKNNQNDKLFIFDKIKL